MREIVVDTETTGLDPADGHRIVEIGCVELIDGLPSGSTRQYYLNPGRPVGESERIHGIPDKFLAGQPPFCDIADELMAFLSDVPLVMHNAAFDLKFINYELRRAARSPIPYARAVDTLEIARSKIPGARYSLDELCRRFGVDLASRVNHGALIDANLTAHIYLELMGGRQTRLKLAPANAAVAPAVSEILVPRLRPQPLSARVTAEELAAHIAFVAVELGGDAVWNWA